MLSTDLVEGQWYTVKVKEYDYASWKVLRGAQLVAKKSNGWHHFKVLMNQNDGNFDLKNNVIHAKSVVGPTEDPMPQAGTPEYKAWIQKGIDEGLEKAAKAQHAEDMEEIISLLPVLFGGDDIKIWHIGTGTNTSIYMRPTETAASARILDILQTLVKNKLTSQ